VGEILDFAAASKGAKVVLGGALMGLCAVKIRRRRHETPEASSPKAGRRT
jgi:hypothetical protein